MRNRLKTEASVLEPKVMLAGTTATSEPSVAIPPTRFNEAAVDLSESPEQAPDQVFLPTETTAILQGLFADSLESGLEEITTFDFDGAESGVVSIESRSADRGVFQRPEDGIIRAHTHFVEQITNDLGETGDLNIANSPGDLRGFLTSVSDPNEPLLLGGLVQSGEITYYALATIETLNVEVERDSQGRLEADIGAFIDEEAKEIANARDPNSEGGVTETVGETQRAFDHASAALWDDFGFVLYRGETGTQADGSTVLERIDFRSDANGPQASQAVQNADADSDQSSTPDADRTRGERGERGQTRGQRGTLRGDRGQRGVTRGERGPA